MSDQFENDGPYQDAVSAEEIERRIMDSAFPKNSMEWWARGEIESLRTRIAELKAALKPFTDEKHTDGLPDWTEDGAVIGCNIQVRDLRAARAALKGEKG